MYLSQYMDTFPDNKVGPDHEDDAYKEEPQEVKEWSVYNNFFF